MSDAPLRFRLLLLEAYEHVQHFRSTQRHILESIGRRNARMTTPYTYLAPRNVGRRTGI